MGAGLRQDFRRGQDGAPPGLRTAGITGRGSSIFREESLDGGLLIEDNILIEKVLGSGGSVIFVPSDSLSDPGRIVLLFRQADGAR
jgi:hypothetical protein